MIVYSLREDRQQVADTQAASLSPKPFGVKQTHGLFGSEEWWRKIEAGVIPLVRLRGRITWLFRVGMHNDTSCFEMTLPDGHTFAYDCLAINRRDRRHYRGARLSSSIT